MLLIKNYRKKLNKEKKIIECVTKKMNRVG